MTYIVAAARWSLRRREEYLNEIVKLPFEVRPSQTSLLKLAKTGLFQHKNISTFVGGG